VAHNNLPIASWTGHTHTEAISRKI